MSENGDSNKLVEYVRFRACPEGTVWYVRRFTAESEAGPWVEDLTWRKTDVGRVQHATVGRALGEVWKLDPRVIAARERLQQVGAAMGAAIRQNVRNGMSPIGRVILTQQIEGEQ